MADREKVLKGLEICSEHGSWHGLDCEHNEAYKDCPYRGCETGCIVTIAKDAIALLKEQEAKYGYWKNPNSQDCHCSECGEQPVHEPGESVPLYDYCPYCGAKMEVKWNEQP